MDEYFLVFVYFFFDSTFDVWRESSSVRTYLASNKLCFSCGVSSLTWHGGRDCTVVALVAKQTGPARSDTRKQF